MVRSIILSAVFTVDAIVCAQDVAASPLSKKTATKEAYITVLAGARVADEMCPTSGRQEEGWARIVAVQSKAFASGDYEQRISDEAAHQRPSMDSRENWCALYEKNLEDDLSKIAFTPEFRKSEDLRHAVCSLQDDYVSARKVVPDFVCRRR